MPLFGLSVQFNKLRAVSLYGTYIKSTMFCRYEVCVFGDCVKQKGLQMCFEVLLCGFYVVRFIRDLSNPSSACRVSL